MFTAIHSMSTGRLPRQLLAAAVLAGAALLPVSAQAETAAYRLADPVVALVPIIKSHEADLKLNAEQKEKFAQWLATAPAKRKAAEDKLIDTRLKLRQALLSGMGDAPERQAMIKDIGEQEAALVAMRATCVDNMRALLTPEQFKQAVGLYEQSLKHPAKGH